MYQRLYKMNPMAYLCFLFFDNELQKSVDYYNGKYPHGEVPHPSFWGGWRVKPRYIEFWQGRSNRLHDRVCFEKSDSERWTQFKLNP